MKNRGGFLFGIKTRRLKITFKGSIWIEFDLLIFHQAHFYEAAIVLFLII